MKCAGLQETMQGRWVRVGSGGDKGGAVTRIYSDTALHNSISFNLARKKNPFCEQVVTEKHLQF